MMEDLEVDQTIMKISWVRLLGAHKSTLLMTVNQVFRAIRGWMPCADALVPIRIIYSVDLAHQRSELELTEGLFLFHEAIYITA